MENAGLGGRGYGGREGIVIEYQVTLYGCEFKCGHRHVKNKKLMEAHERRCWKNPANRTCKTCRYEDYFDDSAGYVEAVHMSEPSWWCRNCEHPDSEGGTNDAIDAIYAELTKNHPDNTRLYGVQIPPVLDCPMWEIA